MNKIVGFLLVITGVLLIIISVLALVKAFNIFTTIGKDLQSIGYVFGSIIFPLLLTVFGRWLYRQGIKRIRKSDPVR